MSTEMITAVSVGERLEVIGLAWISVLYGMETRLHTVCTGKQRYGHLESYIGNHIT